MNDMAVIVPSRGRPGNIKRLYKALSDTEAKVDLIVGVDQDDPFVDEYTDMADKIGDLIVVVSTVRRRFGPTLNIIAQNFVNYYKYLAWMGDDHLPITKHWDQRYREELDNGAGIVYGNDLVMGESIATQLAFTPDIVKALGRALPEDFIHLYIDNYFMALGEKIGGSVYLPDVIVQHLHPVAGKAEQDLTYTEANSQENWSNDKRVFEEYIIYELPNDVEKIEYYRGQK